MASRLDSSHSSLYPEADLSTAFPLILEHVLRYPEHYQISTGSRREHLVKQQNFTSSDTALKEALSLFDTLGLDSLFDSLEHETQYRGKQDEDHRRELAETNEDTPRLPGDTLKDLLIHAIAMSSSQPFTLPPSYITDFVRNVFTEDLWLVDFTQALTGLDYLKQLDERRKVEMTRVLGRLGVDLESFESQKETLKKEKPQLAEWATRTVDKAKRIESLYTQVYIGLRRWTLINEMRLEPFNKHNCIAMLNTLYPATYTTPPTSQLTTMLLNTQRNAFFRYILAVETNGKGVLHKLEQQGKRPADANAWPIVRDIVDKYLRTACGLVQDCTRVKTEADLDALDALDKRVDSGVSFNSAQAAGSKPNTSAQSELDIHPALRRQSPIQENSPPAANNHHRKTSSTSEIALVRPETLRHKDVRKVGSTLERLARELKRMRSRSNEGRGEDDYYHYSDRPRSRSRGASDASQTAGHSRNVSRGDSMTLGSSSFLAPPLTATTAQFPRMTRADDAIDNHNFPRPGQSRPRGLKKMKSATHVGGTSFASRDSIINDLKQAAVKERLGSVSGAAAAPTTRFPEVTESSERARDLDSKAMSEEQRRTLIARARADRNKSVSHSPDRLHSPLEERVEAFLNTAYRSTPGMGNLASDAVTDSPIRKSSPGRNKLRDYYGVTNFEVPTHKFAH